MAKLTAREEFVIERTLTFYEFGYVSTESGNFSNKFVSLSVNHDINIIVVVRRSLIS